MQSAHIFLTERRESVLVAEWHFKGGELGLRASAALALKWHESRLRRTEGGAPFHLVPAGLLRCVGESSLADARKTHTQHTNKAFSPIRVESHTLSPLLV